MEHIKKKYIQILHGCTRFSNRLEHVIEKKIVTRILEIVWILINIRLFFTGVPYQNLVSAACTIAVLVGITFIGMVLILSITPFILRLLIFVISPLASLDEKFKEDHKTSDSNKSSS